MTTEEGLETNLVQHLDTRTHPPLAMRQSNSTPSTPFQHSRRTSFGTRLPSPRNNIEPVSPKTTDSTMENGVRSRAVAVPLTGCKYESGMAFSRRRIPYSVGGDKLDRPRRTDMPIRWIDPAEEKKLSGDMRELYDRLLPSKESDMQRSNFVQKLERILNEQWPGNDIKVHVFGSSGNLLCTSDSDVDICITTPMKALERVCLLAKALADHGMERVVCVSHAKVPIVKFWDPELQLACDMNVNNTLALENTRMIKTYVEIDERVRPLAMIVKHWTRRRILNDAALGGTLSSYTWICMILNFLQTRSPPILPSLHKKPHLRKGGVGAKNAPFDDNIECLRGYGRENKETLGELLFQFFRHYGYAMDYEKDVVSVREGRQISKEAKKWHLMQNNRLCVEEPFNTERNLGNTADDISFRGIHLELRRAFDLLLDGKLDECLEQYTFPTPEEKIWEKPPSKPPPVLSRSRSQSQSSRGNGKVYRGGRSGQNSHRNNGRRASSATAMNKFPMPQIGLLHDRYNMSKEALQAGWEQQHLHEQLFNEFQFLQAQEHELRLLQAQKQMHTQMQFHGSGDRPPNPPHSARDHSQFPATSQVPFSAPLQSRQFPYALMYPQVPGTPHYSVHTQPSSPSMKPAQLDLRRSLHRTNTADSSGSGNLRSHSQPARPLPMAVNMQNAHPLPLNSGNLSQYQQLRQPHPQNPADIVYSRGQPMDPLMYQDPRGSRIDMVHEDSVPKEYVGYWVNDSPPSRSYRENSSMSRLPTYHEMHHRVKGVPPSLSRLKHGSRSPSPSPSLPFRDRSFSVQSASSAPIGPQRYERVQGTAPALRASGPVIVNGSDGWATKEFPATIDNSSHTTTISEATSGSDNSYETPATADLETLPNGQNIDGSFALDDPQQYFHAYLSNDLSQRARGYSRGENLEKPPQRSKQASVEPGAPLSINAKPLENVHQTAGGLGIQFGEIEPSHPTRKAEKAKSQESARLAETNANAETQVRTPTNNGHSEKPGASMPLLSPVREVTTPPPVVKSRVDLAGPALTSTQRANGKMDLRIPSFAEVTRMKEAKQGTLDGTLSQQPNGSAPLRPLDGSKIGDNYHHLKPESSKTNIQQPLVNGWQQQSSKKHKRNKSRPSSSQVLPGEAWPTNEVDRKGG